MKIEFKSKERKDTYLSNGGVGCGFHIKQVLVVKSCHNNLFSLVSTLFASALPRGTLEKMLGYLASIPNAGFRKA